MFSRTQKSSLPTRTRPRLAAALSLSALFAVLFHLGPAAASAHCRTTSHALAQYTVTVCITEPVEGETLSGDETVVGTVSLSSNAPGVDEMNFSLNGSHVLADFVSPYRFLLPSDRFPSGPVSLSLRAKLDDGFQSAPASVDVTLSNEGGGSSTPQGFTPSPGTDPAPGDPFVLAAVGDGASGHANSQEVASLIGSWNPNMFLYLGDVYERGSPTEFYNYYRPNDSFGNLRSITNPTIGNHEYRTPGAEGYFDYWADPPHHYSFEAEGWHFISLDTTEDFDQLGHESAQYQWLEEDLQASSTDCTIAFFHHPAFSVGRHGDTPEMIDIWSLLARYGVDVVLAGHDHDYQRWKQLNGSGSAVSSGITQFVVGTGGKSVYAFTRTDGRLAKGVDSSPGGYGALRLELQPDSASFFYVATNGDTLDSGALACHRRPSDTRPPTAPTSVSASKKSTEVSLSWSGATDDVKVTGYKLYRNGAAFAEIGTSTTYRDATVAPGTTYQYEIRARDGSGNLSPPVNLSATTPLTSSPVFKDGFESGNMSSWTSSSNLTVQSRERYAGSYAARGTGIAVVGHATKKLSTGYKQLHYRLRVKVLYQDSKPLNLIRFRKSGGSSILRLYRTSSGHLAYRNEVTDKTVASSYVLTKNSWHDLQMKVLINGTSSQTVVWLDGVRIDSLRKTSTNLGTSSVGRIQLDETVAHTFDVVFDEVSISP